MSKTVSTINIRQRISDILERVALRNDEFIVQRKGKALAAIVPLVRLEQMRRFARAHALEVMDHQRGGALSNKQAAELAEAARRWARRRPTRSPAKRK
jgi:antitoxin (DNA-binding transcriptional repressor) of toxin-antitoxin stability system